MLKDGGSTPFVPAERKSMLQLLDYDEETQLRFFRRWFMQNILRAEGQSSIHDLVANFQEFTYLEIDKETMISFLRRWNIIVENDVVLGVRIWEETK